MKHFGRPFSVLTPEAVAALITEYDAKPFNVAARARALGLKRGALEYHLRGGKVAVTLGCASWRAALQKAYRALRTNNPTEAAWWLRETARRVEASP